MTWVGMPYNMLTTVPTFVRCEASDNRLYICSGGCNKGYDDNVTNDIYDGRKYVGSVLVALTIPAHG